MIQQIYKSAFNDELEKIASSQHSINKVAKIDIIKNIMRGENEIFIKHLVTELSKKGLTTKKKKQYAN